ncbi:uncharacterized protein [Drosophila virilis]|uniref:Uncharacterized protein n=1 Tax=Drosophila virilis TaxID=7244 RepID=B4M2K1_DROVI|nr:uncharacterized protein LOC6631552 [Drosophila virilis]EDW65905.2 uncharacterized protein Dvir_GJ19507 [Drosophila virilis]
MLRAPMSKSGLQLLQLLLLLAVGLCAVQARWTLRPRRTTTTSTTTTSTTAMPAQSDRHQHVHHWPPLVAPQAPQSQSQPKPPGLQLLPALTANKDNTRLIDSFDQRSPDGQHEYRFQLSNGDTRYERSYWLPVGKSFVLARRGYYSVPLPNGQYSTVFYRADHQGYHVDTHTLSGEQPLLPRTLDVPHDVAAMKSTPTAKRNSISVPERNDEELAQHPDALAVGINTSRKSTRSGSTAKGQTEADVRLETNNQTQTQHQNQTKPSTVATVDDIFAAKVGTAPADDDDDVVADDDDDDEVADSNINVN